MQANFAKCLDFVLHGDGVTFWGEGGFVDNPADPGGATNRGITLQTYCAVNPEGTLAGLKALTDAEAGAIYKALYWAPVQADALPAGVDLMVFDMAVNSGCRRSVMLLQECLLATPDGLMGPHTLAQLAGTPTLLMIERLSRAQDAFYRSLPTWGEFGHGWTNRLTARQRVALGMVQPAAPAAPVPAQPAQPSALQAALLQLSKDLQALAAALGAA